MTSANRSSEPIAYTEQDAFERLAGVADAFLAGERPIARRVDDSVARVGAFGPAILRRARGYAPGAVAELADADGPFSRSGADLKNTVTLVVDGQAFVSQHIGDLDHYQAFQAFQETIRDLVSMYDVRWERFAGGARRPSAIPARRPTLWDSMPGRRLACSTIAPTSLPCLPSAANGSGAFSA